MKLIIAIAVGLIIACVSIYFSEIIWALGRMS